MASAREKDQLDLPGYDPRMVSTERMEEICAGGEDDIDFRYEFEAFGHAFHIGPGETVSWPARAPHRILNGDTLNVSLSTFHEAVEDYDRVVEHRSDYRQRNSGWAGSCGALQACAPSRGSPGS